MEIGKVSIRSQLYQFTAMKAQGQNLGFTTYLKDMWGIEV